ncbi:MAG: nucleoside phosphorylase [Oligoflexia bacterium]|nr:nucleoside phosphorylase [Oligoflexia bacterium]
MIIFNDSPSLLTAKRYVGYFEKNHKLPEINFPKSVLLTFQPYLFSWIKDQQQAKSYRIFGMDLLILPASNVGVVGGFGIGAPVTAIVVEELAALGVENFIIVGIAGSLQKAVRIADVVLCERAIRDEGTSYHYLPDSPGESCYANANAELCAEVIQRLTSASLTLHRGAGWTTDAPYRESIERVQQLQQQAILTVDMEASALFAVANYLELRSTAVFVISDSLADLSWSPHFFSKEVSKKLQVVCKNLLT